MGYIINVHFPSPLAPCFGTATSGIENRSYASVLQSRLLEEQDGCSCLVEVVLKLLLSMSICVITPIPLSSAGNSLATSFKTHYHVRACINRKNNRSFFPINILYKQPRSMKTLEHFFISLGSMRNTNMLSQATIVALNNLVAITRKLKAEFKMEKY